MEVAVKDLVALRITCQQVEDPRVPVNIRHPAKNIIAISIAGIIAGFVPAELRGDDLKVVAIDGKTLRHSFDTDKALRPLHIVSAWVADHHISLGQVATEGKSNEITAIPA